MKKTVRFLTAVITAALLLSMIPVFAYADETADADSMVTVNEEVSFTEPGSAQNADDGITEVAGESPEENTEAIIPEEDPEAGETGEDVSADMPDPETETALENAEPADGGEQSTEPESEPETSLEVEIDEEGLVLNEETEAGISNLSFGMSAVVLATEDELQLVAKEKLSYSKTAVEVDPLVLTWKSSNPKVATVNKNGLVKSKSYGTTIITATAPNGVEAFCEVSTRFYDVNGSSVSKSANYQYYYNAVYWAAENNITKGYNGVYFAPQADCQRREMMIFLWRQAGSPTKDKNGKSYGDARKMFKDLAGYGTGTDTNKAIAWGYKEGITKGYSDGGFHPKASITRKDTLILIYRVAKKPKTRGKTGQYQRISFDDVISLDLSPVSDTYRAILWSQNCGIANGYDDGTFQPNGKCLREHIITFLYRYSKLKLTAKDYVTDATDAMKTRGQEIVDYAAGFVGVTPYVPGGHSLWTGTDCSGFVHLIYEAFGIYTSWASDDYQTMEKQITQDELIPGDIIVYRYGGHVGIYAGNNQIIHAANERSGTQYLSMWYSTPTAYVRVLK